jgi:hypothetical protein
MSKMPVPAGVSPEDARLAWELVANFSSIGDIMRRHGLSFDDLDAKKRDPAFATLLKQYEKHWNSELSVNQRVALKAALLTEDSLLDVYQIIKNGEASPGQKLEAFGALAKAGEVGVQRKDQAAAGTPVHININIPGHQGVTIDATPVEVSDAEH